MKRLLIFAALAVFLLPAATVSAQGIFWDGETIPDPVFRSYVLDKFDTDRDGRISKAEADAVSEMQLISKKVKSLQGIEKFSQLDSLACMRTELTSLDLSKNTTLAALSCDSNPQLTTLDISNNTALILLMCDYNKLTSLDISNNTALIILMCDHNKLTSLDVSKNTALTDLSCGSNELTFLDVSKNTALKQLHCGRNPFTNIDLSHNTALTRLECNGNKLTSLDLSENTALTSLGWSSNPHFLLDLSKLPALTSLDCSYNNLTSLDLPNISALTELKCGGNRFTSFDVSKFPALTSLDCSSNNLTSLDVSKLPALTSLDCRGNNLTSLDVSKNTALTSLNCSFNNFTSLDVSKNTALTSFSYHGGSLTSLDLSHNLELTDLRISRDASINTLNVSNLSKLKTTDIRQSVIQNIIVNNKTNITKDLSDALFLHNARKEDQRQEQVDREREAEQRLAQAQQKAAEYKRQIVPYISRNDWEGADSFAANALTNLPSGDAYLYFVRAKAYYMRNLDFGADPNENVASYFKAYRQEAIRLLSLCNNSISCDRSDSNEAYLLRGFAYTILGQANDAAADFRRYMAGVPTDKALCYYNIGVAFKNADWWKDALENFKLARQYYTDKKKIDQCLMQIKACQEKMDGK